MMLCPFCGGDESKCDFSFDTETCSQMIHTQDNRSCVVLADGSVVWDAPNTKQVEDAAARKLCEDEGLSWDRLSESYESPLNEFRSKAYFRHLANARKDSTR